LDRNEKAHAERWTVSAAANKVLRVVQWTLLLLLRRFDARFLWTMAFSFTELNHISCDNI
jgi:hypothetical protein